MSAGRFPLPAAFGLLAALAFGGCGGGNGAVIPANGPPTARDVSTGTDIDTSKAIVLDASDPDGDSLVYEVLSGPAHGTLSGEGERITYQPDSGYTGADSFTYRAYDAQDYSNIATVSIFVGANVRPLAEDVVVGTAQDTPVAVTLQATDPNGDQLSYEMVGQPAHGTVSGTGAQLTYQPEAGYFGADTFTYRGYDGELLSNSATVRIEVTTSQTGTVWAWGWNRSGQVGDGTFRSRYRPVQVRGLKDVVMLAADWEHSLALKADGTVWAWGDNWGGQLGDGTTLDRPSPVRVQGLQNVVQIAAGWSDSVALLGDGSVRTWGAGCQGALGCGDSYDPGAILQTPKGVADVRTIAASAHHTLVVKNDGTVWAWGDNGSGELGDGTTEDRWEPVQVQGLTDVVQVATGFDHSVALKSDGTVWGWGSNVCGQLGDGTTEERHTPVQATFSAQPATMVAAGPRKSVVVTLDGAVWFLSEWQPGDTYVPVQKPTLEGLTGIAMGQSGYLALLQDGTVWIWGGTRYGYSENDLQIDGYSEPTRVVELTGAVAVGGAPDGYGHSLVALSLGHASSTITLTSPSGGEIWTADAPATVAWVTTGMVGGTNMRIELSTDGGSSWSTLAACTPNDGSERVTVPDMPSSDCLIRVCEIDGDPRDTSDAAFAVTASQPNRTVVVSPNGGETVIAGQGSEVRWTAPGTAGNVEVHYSVNGGQTYPYLIATVPAADGSCTWQVPDERWIACRVRVRPEGGVGSSDESDADFAILPLFDDAGAALHGVFYGSVAWGDSDADGDLDLALAGDIDGVMVVTNVYRNDGGGIFADIRAGLTGVECCSVAWGDCDGDGRLDLAISGALAGSGPPASWVYRNTGTGFSGSTLEGELAQNCSLAWGDYDNDGDLDIALAGEGRVAGTWGRASRIYRNDADGTFSDIGAGLTAVGYDGCALAWGDYDNDGDLDLAIAGEDSTGTTLSKVYRNDGDGTFTDIDAGLAGVYRCTLAWGDCDSDGDLDLALGGRTASWEGVEINRIYLNEGGMFVDGGTVASGVTAWSMAWGDCDNDGDLDLAIAGRHPDGTIGDTVLIYCNEGGSTFTDVGVRLEAGVRSSAAWGDYDNDGDLDLAVTYVEVYESGKLYQNGCSVPNTPPTAPEALSAVAASGEATFSWQPATDAETPAPGLTYNLRVWTDDGSVITEVMPGMSDPVTGRRLIPAMGNVQHAGPVAAPKRSWTLHLPAGECRWTVQAVDTAFSGGAWAPEQTVTVP